MGEGEGAAFETTEHVEIGGFGGEGERERGQRGLTVESGSSHTSAGQEVGNGFQAIKKDSMGRWGEMPRAGDLSCGLVPGQPPARFEGTFGSPKPVYGQLPVGRPIAQNVIA